MNDSAEVLGALLAVATVAVLAPLLLGLLPWLRVPQVVLLLVGGMVIGPQLLALARPGDVQPLSDIGLGFVFLLAGYEIDQRLYRSDAGRRALGSWVITAVLAVGAVGALAALGLVHAFVPVAIALTTTAFGTLVPILREGGLLGGRLGGFLVAAGAVGELLPILAIALLLGVSNRFVALISLGVITVVSVLLSLAPRVVRAGGRLARVIAEGQHETAQLTLRITVLLLVSLLAVAEEFRLDAVLGAFVALLVLVRGLPALLVYRRVLSLRERVQVVLVTATALPLLVALSEIGLRNGTMLPENAAALVGAGVVTVVALPTIAIALRSRERVGR